LPVGVAAIDATGLFSLIDPAEPKNATSPKLKIPPSAATSQ